MNALLKLGGAVLLATALAVPGACAQSTVTGPGGTTSGTYMDYMKTVYDRAGAPEVTSLPLTEFDGDFKLNPMGAKSWTQSADGLTWTFKLQDNLVWSDGTPLTADGQAILDRGWDMREEFGAKDLGVLGQLVALLTHDARADLGRITSPTLVLAGSADALSPLRQARLLARSIPGARLEILAGAPHGMNLATAPLFNANVEAFLAQHSPLQRVAG